jgi:hypothetical protein
MSDTEKSEIDPRGGSVIADSQHARDNSQRGGEHSQQARTGDISFDFGPAAIAIVIGLMLVICACGVVIGLDISERQTTQERTRSQIAELRDHIDAQVRASQIEIDHYKEEFQKLTVEYKELKTQNWLLERRLMDKEALDIIHGDKLPSDSEYGATGNLQRMKPKEKDNGRK